MSLVSDGWTLAEALDHLEIPTGNCREFRKGIRVRAGEHGRIKRVKNASKLMTFINNSDKIVYLKVRDKEHAIPGRKPKQ